MSSPGPEGSLEDPIEEYPLQSKQSNSRQFTHLLRCQRQQQNQGETEEYRVRTENGRRSARSDLLWIGPTRSGKTRPQSDRSERGRRPAQEGTPTRARSTRQLQRLRPGHRVTQQV